MNLFNFFSNSLIDYFVFRYFAVEPFIISRPAYFAHNEINVNENDCTICVSDKWNLDDGTITLLIDELSNHQICARIENDYQDLIKEPIVEMLIALLRLAVDRKHPHDWEFIVSTMANLWSLDSLQSNDDYFNMQNDLNEEIKQLSIMMDWILAIEYFEGLHSVLIMTIHKSKGLEYDVVYFVGLEDSAFWSFKSQPDEDRCNYLYYLVLNTSRPEYCNRKAYVYKNAWILLLDVV